MGWEFSTKKFDDRPRMSDNGGNLIIFEPNLLATARDGETTPP